MLDAAAVCSAASVCAAASVGGRQVLHVGYVKAREPATARGTSNGTWVRRSKRTIGLPDALALKPNASTTCAGGCGWVCCVWLGVGGWVGGFGLSSWW
jgi:hypothetical protein